MLLLATLKRDAIAWNQKNKIGGITELDGMDEWDNKVALDIFTSHSKCRILTP